jgi:hypothetical protein
MLIALSRSYALPQQLKKELMLPTSHFPFRGSPRFVEKDRNQDFWDRLYIWKHLLVLPRSKFIPWTPWNTGHDGIAKKIQ